MRLSAAHWAGVGRIIYACPKTSVSLACYEGRLSLSNATAFLEPPIILAYIPGFESRQIALLAE